MAYNYKGDGNFSFVREENFVRPFPHGLGMTSEWDHYYIKQSQNCDPRPPLALKRQEPLSDKLTSVQGFPGEIQLFTGLKCGKNTGLTSCSLSLTAKVCLQLQFQ